MWWIQQINTVANNRKKLFLILNGQFSKWSLVEARVPRGSILSPLLFVVYINDLPQGLGCNAKLFSDDSSLFITVTRPVNIIIKFQCRLISSSNFNVDLRKIAQWAYQWKMSFNPD